MNIHQLSAEEFRKKLAGLVDPLKKMDEFEQSALKDEIVNFCSILPELFSSDLERKTLWERIGNGIKISLAKSSGNFENFINSSLEYIKSEPGKVASNENFEKFLTTSLLRPKEWKDQFLRLLENRLFIILVRARDRWNEKIGR